jgi:cobyric acid synthase CobQ/L-threonine-O-3-phosphate decarboxylase
MHELPHGGNLRHLAEISGRRPEDILDFSASINPLGPPEWLREELAAAAGRLAHYPDPDCAELIAAAATRYGVSAEEIVAGNGSTELLHAACAMAAHLGCTRAVVTAPAYGDYARAAEAAGLEVEEVLLREDEGFALDHDRLNGGPGRPSLVILCRPHNPTGMACKGAALRAFAAAHPESLVLVDEAYADFAPGLDRLTADRPGNVITLLSLTKFYAVPGLRLGLALAAPDLAAGLRSRVLPWSVNALAQAVGVRALADTAYAAASVADVDRLRAGLSAGLAALPGITVFPSTANFLLCRLPETGPNAPELARRLLVEHGVAIRVCTNFSGLGDRHFRVAVRGEADNGRLLDALAAVLAAPRPPVFLRPRKTPALMVQATSSNAGKSVLCAALCRILLQDGYAVAPFKAQNMSLNSFVDRQGRELGRAQATQARACRLDPDARMNPVLLKPNSDTGSQVILLGRPVGSMNVAEYIAAKPDLFRAVQSAYDELAAEHEVMVLEGAGSPAEINLKAHDIVNMRMAGYARARVLLAGDIDRGGVFAALAGTMDLLTEAERTLVAGFVLNKFRGDPSLLQPALDALARRTGRPFYGTVPFLPDLGLPEEDSVSFKSGILDLSPDQAGDPARVVDVALLDLPHVSNFTDLDALAGEPDVRARVVRRATDLGAPHALILPGSKSVPGDLAYLRSSGLADAVLALAREGRCEIVGLCGGLQMLGLAIADPHGLESGGATVPGLGLLAVDTELAAEKTLTQARATHVESGLELAGYEIHHGLTRARGDEAAPAVRRGDGEVIGFAAPGGLVWGTYVHGTFDADPFRRWFLDRLRVRAGLPALGRIMARFDLEPALDRLADAVRASLDMAGIRSLLGLGLRRS